MVSYRKNTAKKTMMTKGNWYQTDSRINSKVNNISICKINQTDGMTDDIQIDN